MKRLFSLLLMLTMLLSAASAEIFIIEDETHLPEGWTEKELFRLSAIDVNRSDAMLLQCGGESMMIDGGSSGVYHLLVDYLETAGVTEFKYLFNTHPDNDHIDGLTAMMKSGNYTIGGFYSAVKKNYTGTSYHQPAVRAAAKADIPYVQVFNGDVLTLGSATINIFRCDKSWGTNARSACTQIIFGDSKVLLMGDCPSKAQNYFLENIDPSLLECDILKAVHHGINTFEPAFLEVAQPEFIFVPNYKSHKSIGNTRRNKFAQYKALYSGDGTVIMETDGTDWYIWQLPNWTKKK